MLNESLSDVPSPIDLRQLPDAQAWAETALAKRPDRPLFFARFAQGLREAGFNQVQPLLNQGGMVLHRAS